MSAETLERPAAGTPPPVARRSVVRDLLRTRGSSAAWLLPLLVLTGTVLAVGLDRVPQRIDDEGTYVAQAFAVLNYGELAHYTYFYDHPPLGWLQLAGWFRLTGALLRYDSAVLAGREFVVVATLVSALLLWLLGRRLGLSRPAAGAALAIFALSPLAVQYHRTVYLDNIATPWLLAAFLLVLAPRRQLLGYTLAAGAFAVAVLTKETYLLFLPFVIWTAWQNADSSTRRYAFSVAAAVLTLGGSTYVLLAAIRGELVPAVDRTSLWEGVTFQLVARNGSGSLFDADSLARITAAQWWSLDPVLIVAVPIAALVALRWRRLRPVAAAVLALVLFTLRPGYLPVPYVIALIPLGALLVPAVLDRVIRATRGRHRALVAIPVALAVALTAVAVPVWGPQLRGQLLADLDRPMRQAQAWLEQNAGRDQRLIVDDSLWVDLVRAGFEREDVVWYYKVDTDPAVAAFAPNGWRDYDLVVSTNSMRTFPDGFPVVAEALANSTVVASFGEGDAQVTVHRVDRAGVQVTGARRVEDESARSAAGEQLVRNTVLTFPPTVRDLVTGGRVDGRALTVLSGTAGELGPLTVTDAPEVPGEEDTVLPRRQVLLTGPGIDRDPAAAAERLLAVAGDLRPAAAEPGPDGLLVTWSLSAPADVLPVTPS